MAVSHSEQRWSWPRMMSNMQDVRLLSVVVGDGSTAAGLGWEPELRECDIRIQDWGRRGKRWISSLAFDDRTLYDIIVL